MFTSHPTLLIGPADWEPRAHAAGGVPAAHRRAVAGARRTAARAIVYGDAAHHAELAYLTNLTPKLEACGGASCAHGRAPRLFVGGGPNMLGAARPLTWIAGCRAAARPGRRRSRRDTGAALADRCRQHADRAASDDHEALGEGAAGRDARSLWALMRRKSPAELAAIRAACDALRAAMTAIAARTTRGRRRHRSGARGRARGQCKPARRMCARCSASIGGRTLMPFAASGRAAHRSAAGLRGGAALQLLGRGLCARSRRSLPPAAAKATELLQAALAAIRPGVEYRARSHRRLKRRAAITRLIQ